MQLNTSKASHQIGVLDPLLLPKKRDCIRRKFGIQHDGDRLLLWLDNSAWSFGVLSKRLGWILKKTRKIIQIPR